MLIIIEFNKYVSSFSSFVLVVQNLSKMLALFFLSLLSIIYFAISNAVSFLSRPLEYFKFSNNIFSSLSINSCVNLSCNIFSSLSLLFFSLFFVFFLRAFTFFHTLLKILLFHIHYYYYF